MSHYEVHTAPLVNVRITSNLSNFAAEKRYDRGLTIGDLKGRLELVTGASPASMTLEIYDDKDQLVGSITEDEALLGSFPVEENYRLHVTDSHKKVGEFEDISKVEKFELSEEEYTKRNDFKRSSHLLNKFGNFNHKEQLPHPTRLADSRKPARLATTSRASTPELAARRQAAFQDILICGRTRLFFRHIYFNLWPWATIKYGRPMAARSRTEGDTKTSERVLECCGHCKKPGVFILGDDEFAEGTDDE
ncbi:unnamed protein product, partial [Meganyctiphanes norvegica]